MKHNQIRQVVFPILAALIWGTAFVAQDVCADTIGTFTFNAVRYFIAVLALLVLIAVLHAVHKDRPQPTEAEKRTGRKQLWLGGFCCGTALAIASNFQQAGITAGTDAGKAGFLTALYVVLVPVFGLFSGAGSACRYGSRSRCRSYPCTCCASRAASGSPRATCSCSCARCALPCTFWSSTTSVQRATG